MAAVAKFTGAGTGSHCHRVLAGRWFTVLASLLIMSVSGATYMYGLYSSDIKSTLGYDQTTLNLLGFFKDMGGNIGILSGLLNEVTPPWAVLSVGASMNFFGYFMIWLAVAGKATHKPQVWQMCLYICVGASSQTFANTGALVTCVNNFPRSRGIVIGLLKGFVGLSGAIITQLYHGFCGHDGDNSKALILFIAWLPSAVSVVFLRTVRVMKNNAAVRGVDEVKVFYDLLYISLALAGFLMLIITVQNWVVFNHIGYEFSAALVLLLLLAPLVVVMKADFNIWRKKEELHKGMNRDPGSQIEVVTGNPSKLESTLQGATRREEQLQPQGPSANDDRAAEGKNGPISWLTRNVFQKPERGEDYTILQAMCSLDMVILFATATFGVGGTLTAIDNLGQIGKSLGYENRSITTFVSLVSIWNYLGRVTSGFASETLLAKYRFPRPLMLTVVLLLSCAGHLLIAFAVPNSLYAASIIMGFCFGAQWPLIFSIISELFGLKYYSTLMNLGAAASPAGAYILNVKVAGHIYDKVALKQIKEKGLDRKAGQDLSCIGVECYRLSFLIITATAFCGCFISSILVVRTREFYKGDIYKKFRDEEDRSASDNETLVEVGQKK